MMPSTASVPGATAVLARLSPRQRQYALLCAIVGGSISLLWLVFVLSENPPRQHDSRPQPGGTTITQIGVMPPGAQVNPVDQWVGNAGRKLAQFESDREEQARLNKERQAFESRTLQRFLDLEQKLTAPPPAPPAAAPAPATRPASAPAFPTSPAFPQAATGARMPPASALPGPALPRTTRAAPPWIGAPTDARMSQPVDPPPTLAPTPAIVHVTVSRAAPADDASSRAAPGAARAAAPEARTIATFLPVSFTRGVLLGGLDAPTGGQAQSNPHPVLIRLADNSVLPNQFRGSYRECFVVAAGYGDISSERAYLRTESLSCVRADGATLEVRIQGSVYGEDGKVGMRGRLVTKQGQMLGNALLAGVVSGIGQGLASSNTEYATSALGTVASSSGNEAYRAGVGSGVGRALDRLAQYYIRLAENTFPVIEIDAGRSIDVVITRGVRIDVPVNSPAPERARDFTTTSPATRYLESPDDENY